MTHQFQEVLNEFLRINVPLCSLGVDGYYLYGCQKTTQPMSALFKKGTKSIESIENFRTSVDSEWMRAAVDAQSLCFNSRESICGWFIPCLFSDSRPCFPPLSSAQLRYPRPHCSCRSKKISAISKYSARVTRDDWKQLYRRKSWSKTRCNWGEGRVRATTTVNIGFIHFEK